jgi:hypothetical protein
MSGFACPFCGTSATATSTHCANCSSELRFETGNPYTGKPLFQRKLLVISSIALAFVMVFNTLTLSLAGSQASAFFASALAPLGSTQLGMGDDYDLGLSDGSDSDYGTDAGTDSDTDFGTDPGIDSGNTYYLSDSEIADGYSEWDSSGIAWRWATDSETADMYCEPSATSCTWVSVIALRTCVSVLINTDVSTDESYNNEADVAIGYGNDDIDFSGLYAGDKQFIEVDAYGDYPGGTWMYMSSITCGDSNIGHD